MADKPAPQYHYFKHDKAEIIKKLGKDRLKEALKRMLLIRNFEIRAESAYQHGKVGGFFHAYIGQEAIQTAAVMAIGADQWWTTTYRCHALALLLGATPNELMAELYGKATGNAKGRGGSMHFYTPRLLGGFGIVGGQVPVATGAAFTVKYLDQKGASVCFMGEGAVAQGAVHESWNLAALWDLPAIYVIENNKWGMGTSVARAISLEPIAETKGPSYGMEGYTIDGMDFFNCYAAFEKFYADVKQNSRPILVEAITERFRGHSISDPAFYRSKEDLQKCLLNDPIVQLKGALIENGMLTEEEFETMDKEQKAIVIEAMKFAEESPDPDPLTLEEDVFAP